MAADPFEKIGQENGGVDAEGVAHDMRTPLSVIKSFLEVIPVEEDEIREFHLAAKRSLEKVLGLVEELSAPAKPHIRMDKINLVETVDSAINSVASIADAKQIDIRYVGPEVLFTLSDGKQLDRAITNLVLNAIEASTRRSEVRVELFLSHGAIVLAVIDTGCGIDKRYTEKVFERGFTRGKKSGTGIGLNLCQKIAADHGGRIEAFSRKGLGSVFTIVLPDFLAAYSDSLPQSNFPLHAERIITVNYAREETMD